MASQQPEAGTSSLPALADYADTEAATGSAHSTPASSIPATSVFPFLELPRELRDQETTQIYDCVLELPDTRGERALRIERRHLKYFKPSAASFLLLLHHEYFLLDRQVAAEALESLLKNHTPFLSCGPFVLQSLFTRIEEEPAGQGKQWLRWMRKIELDWITFPNLAIYPPNRENGKDEWPWEADDIEVDVEYVKGFKDTEMSYGDDTGYNDEYDYEGDGYDDNFYDPVDMDLYPSFEQPTSSMIQQPAGEADDPFGLTTIYPFSDPSSEPDHDTTSQETLYTKLDLLISLEVTPLFTYFSSPVFSLSSITLPLYFISKSSLHHRSAARPGYALPLKLRYWVAVAVHALLLLCPPDGGSPALNEVRIKYLAWDIWANMDPSDDIYSMPEKGVWFKDGDGREGQGEAFRAVWNGLFERGLDVSNGALDATVKLVQWHGDLEQWRVGDELDVVFTRAGKGKEKAIQ
ncbi:hypothetical protein BDV96DRAFT_502492 [Lophiotrema nucula]|uniref:Uncharacterized protein n=1 Tax=Lophiotrema nucula TaxID=690887 RepID=A0A6A5YTL3_9PLEO|nr:hypothetical protein BDV96DRAFT_502492 [Lophiotrema nucula]